MSRAPSAARASSSGMNLVSEAPNEGRDVENYSSMFPPTDRMGFLFAQVCQWERQRKWLYYLSAEDIAVLGTSIPEYLKKFAACIAANDRSLLRLLDLDGLFERPQKEVAASQVAQRDHLQQEEVVEPAQELRADAERSLLRLGNRERGGVRGHVLIQVLSGLWAQESQSSLQPLLDVFHSYLSCVRASYRPARGGVLVLDGCWLGRLLKSCIDQEVHQDFAEITALVDDPLEDAVTRKMLRAPPIKPGEPDKYEEEKKEDVGFYDFFPYVDQPLNRTSRHEHMRSVSVPYREEEVAEKPARFPKGGSYTLLDTAGWAKQQQQQQQQQAAHFSDSRPPTTVYVTSFGFCTDDAARALQKETRCLTSQMLCKFREVKRNISIEYWIHVGPIHNRWVHQDRWTNGSEPFRIEQDETTTKDGDEQDQIQQQEEVTLTNEKENEARASRSNRGNPTAKKLKANANWGLSIDELRSLVANDFTILEDTVFPTTMFENPSPGTLLKDERLAWCFVAKRKPMKTNPLEVF